MLQRFLLYLWACAPFSFDKEISMELPVKQKLVCLLEINSVLPGRAWGVGETLLNNRSTGAQYEELAAHYLEQEGYRILKRNYSNQYGEVDLIALWNRDRVKTMQLTAEELLVFPGTMLVICEVKYRRHRGTGDPCEAVTRGKMRHICRTTVGFYLEMKLSDGFPCRFDVISFLGNGEIRHIEDAFPFI